MYKKILLNKNLPFKNRVKNYLTYYLIRRGVKISWDKRFKKIFELHPDYKNPAEREMEVEHKKYWKTLSGNINLNTFRVCKNISGIANPKYIPEEVYVADIEPTLNQTPTVEFLTYKSFYNNWFPNSHFPKCYFHNVDGKWLDQEMNSISFSRIEEIIKGLKYPVVFKPNRDSYGGKGLFFPNNDAELLSQVKTLKNFVVQEKIIQHPFFDKFNSVGLNTIRVCLYRSIIIDNKIHVLNCALRMGVGGSLDNETAGGIVCFIDENGVLNGVARDKYGKNFQFHPDSKLSFSETIPFYHGLIDSSLQLSSKIFYARLFSLDFCLDINEIWRPIEINLFGQTIRFAQYAGHPFLGRFSDEIVEYCKKNHPALTSHK